MEAKYSMLRNSKDVCEPRMEKIYIFDMGGVVAQQTNVLPQVAAHLGISLEDVRAWSKEYAIPLMEGKLSTREFWEIFSERSGISVEEELFGKFFQPVLDTDIYTLIKRLKSRHRVVCGTNTIVEHYAFHVKRGDYQVFDAVYASHLIGIAKPRPEFFQHILEQEKIPPSQAVFIDDSFENVAPAQRLGIHAIHFEGYDTLVNSLRFHQSIPAAFVLRDLEDLRL